MTKLEQLIEQLCPDGVEFLPLWSVTIWDKKFNSVDRSKQNKVITYPYLLASKLFSLEEEGGDVFLLSTGEQTGWTTVDKAGKYLCEGEVVTIPWGKSRAVVDCIKYYKGKFVTADNRIMTSYNTDILNNKYLYYWIMSMGKIIDTFYRGSGIKHPDMAKVLDMRIPVPPLEVQAEIVRILDKFTEITTALAKELANRKKQYEYYRNKILDEVIAKNEHLGDICTFIRGPFGGSLKKECFNTEGYAVYEQQHAIYSSLDIRYFINEQKYQELKRFEVKTNDLIISCSGTIGKVFIIPPNAPKGIINQALLKLSPSELVDSKYLKYCFENTLSTELNNSARGGAIQNVPSVAELKKIAIKVPPIEEQRRIVNILDRFDKLCNDISQGLPAEIEARQKQYEYYRDKLLSFKERDN